jgi:hypothetical protein
MIAHSDGSIPNSKLWFQIGSGSALAIFRSASGDGFSAVYLVSRNTYRGNFREYGDFGDDKHVVSGNSHPTLIAGVQPEDDCAPDRAGVARQVRLSRRRLCLAAGDGLGATTGGHLLKR